MKRLAMMIVLGMMMLVSVATAGKDVQLVETNVTEIDLANPFYVGVGGVWVGVSRDCDCDGKPVRRLKDSTYGEILRLGMDYNEYIGAEARLLQGNMGIDFAKTTHVGLYLKPQYHVTDLVNVYGLAGYGHTTVECQPNGVSAGGKHDFVKNGFSMGAGVEYDLNGDLGGQGAEEKGLGLFLDWQNLASQENKYKTNVNVVAAGVTYDF